MADDAVGVWPAVMRGGMDRPERHQDDREKRRHHWRCARPLEEAMKITGQSIRHNAMLSYPRGNRRKNKENGAQGRI